MSRSSLALPTQRNGRQLARILDRFLAIEAASGLVLLMATAAALIWANSPWSGTYEAFWRTSLSFSVDGIQASHPLRFWVNDAVMTIFFLVVGLEIRRELHDGALADFRVAMLPAVAAAGGVIVPALLYLAVTGSTELRHGWAVPTATDIAFAVGVLTLLGKRVPPSLRVLLLTLAIVDDIVAIVLIAAVYSEGLTLAGGALALCGLLLIVLLQAVGIQRALVYTIPGALVWVGLLKTGLHPTLAGVILGLLTPARHDRQGRAEGLLAQADRALSEMRNRIRAGRPSSRDLLPYVRELKEAPGQVFSPAEHLEAGLHPWVAYGIMPLFALANAGVPLGALRTTGADFLSLTAGIMVALVIGKPVGILLASRIAVGLGLCALPPGISSRHLLVLGAFAGIGFTMSLFLANLAFPDSDQLAITKLAVLLASALAASVGLILGRRLL